MVGRSTNGLKNQHLVSSNSAFPIGIEKILIISSPRLRKPLSNIERRYGIGVATNWVSSGSA